MPTRRSVIGSAAAAFAVPPFAALSGGHAPDVFSTEGGEVRVHPVSHASFVMETPVGVIYTDPVGGADLYSGFSRPDLILVTHHHGDHLSVDTLSGVSGVDTQIVINPKAHEGLPGDLKASATVLANGGSTTFGAASIDAVPAYNLTADRLKYHPKGRDNGYVLGIDGLTVYIAGDTEDIPEMRALSGVDLAFVPMNLPYTMDVARAADAVAEFSPKVCYPYHYKGQDPDAFAALVAQSGAPVDVRKGAWYG